MYTPTNTHQNGCAHPHNKTTVAHFLCTNHTPKSTIAIILTLLIITPNRLLFHFVSDEFKSFKLGSIGGPAVACRAIAHNLTRKFCSSAMPTEPIAEETRSEERKRGKSRADLRATSEWRQEQRRRPDVSGVNYQEYFWCVLCIKVHSSSFGVYMGAAILVCIGVYTPKTCTSYLNYEGSGRG